ncbi:hypothetical protein [Nocardia farcinica]|uniref:hypothetical protein n=1 Tax=Nocardia farcinica TaxID=37329 RepID=UPI0024587999|nr:hypothetical protein [Nocardia farcinica]
MAEKPRFVRVTGDHGVKMVVNVDRIDGIIEPSALTQNKTGLAVAGQAYPCHESVEDILAAIEAVVVDAPAKS